MIVAWIIGILLCLLGLWLHKNSYTYKYDYVKKSYVDRPYLKMWHIILTFLGATIPGVGILTGLSIILAWIVNDNEHFDEDNKIAKFLNKPIR